MAYRLAHADADYELYCHVVPVRRKAVWGPQAATPSLRSCLLAHARSRRPQRLNRPRTRHVRRAGRQAGAPSSPRQDYKLDDELERVGRTATAQDASSVIVTLVPGAELPPQFRRFARGERSSTSSTAMVLDAAERRARSSSRRSPRSSAFTTTGRSQAHNYRTSVTVGATPSSDTTGLHGRRRRRRGHRLGHHDLARRPHRRHVDAIYPYGNQRVAQVRRLRERPHRCRTTTTATARTSPASSRGNGYDSNGEKAGIAPERDRSSSLKVLDANGKGTISNIIAALELGRGERARPTTSASSTCRSARAIHESYWTDPLTLAAKALDDRGIVVVAAAGNFGKNADGRAAVRRHHRAGQRAVGAHRRRLEHEGHARRATTTDGGFSSRGPDADRLRGEARSRRAGHRHGVAGGARQHASTRRSRQYLVGGAAAAGYQAVSDAERHQHGGAGRQRHGRADAAGEPEPDAESGQGDPAVHRAGVRRLQPAAAGRRLPEHARRGPPRAVLREPTRPARSMPVQSVWSQQIIWGNHLHHRRRPQAAGNAWANSVGLGLRR